MSKLRLVSTVVVTASALAALFIALTHASPAQAGRSEAKCKHFLLGDLNPEAVQVWIEGELDAGRQRLISMGNGTICSW
jgi:hypothetical protein